VRAERKNQPTRQKDMTRQDKTSSGGDKDVREQGGKNQPTRRKNKTRQDKKTRQKPLIARPQERLTWPSSQPTTPAPKIANEGGSSVKLKMVSLVRYGTSASPAMAGTPARAPVQMTALANFSDSPPLSTTSWAVGVVWSTRQHTLDTALTATAFTAHAAHTTHCTHCTHCTLRTTSLLLSTETALHTAHFAYSATLYTVRSAQKRKRVVRGGGVERVCQIRSNKAIAEFAGLTTITLTISGQCVQCVQHVHCVVCAACSEWPATITRSAKRVAPSHRLVYNEENEELRSKRGSHLALRYTSPARRHKATSWAAVY
jgi:hypothetical protein